MITTSCAVIATANTTPVTCFGGNDGTVSVTLSGVGSTVPFTYRLDVDPNQNTNSNTFNLSGLNIGPHIITLSTYDTCYGSVTFNIGGPAS